MTTKYVIEKEKVDQLMSWVSENLLTKHGIALHKFITEALKPADDAAPPQPSSAPHASFDQVD